MNTSKTLTDNPSNGNMPRESAQSHSGKLGRAAIVVAMIALIATLMAPYVGENGAREAVARGDLGDVYTVQIAIWSVMVALDVAAIVIGVLGSRRPAGKVLSGAAIGIGASSLLGLLVHLIQTGLITILFT
jgi:hypothetical protein